MPLYIVMYKSKCQAIVLPNKNKLQAYSDRIFKKNIENGYFHQSDSCHDIVVLSIRLKSRHHKFIIPAMRTNMLENPTEYRDLMNIMSSPQILQVKYC